MKKSLPLLYQLQKLCARQLCIVFFVLSFFSFKAFSSNYYWVGGTGNWSDLNHWATTSGGTTLYTQIPTALDDVFFDANSFSAPGQIVTFDALTTLAHSISWAGVTNTPTMAGPFTNMIKVYGSLTFVPGMNMEFTGGINFEATTPGNTITLAGHLLSDAVNFNGIGGEWTLQDALTTLNGISLNNGTLNTNDQQVTAFSFHSITSTARGLNMGSSVFNIQADAVCWWVDDAGMTLNCGTSVINCSNSAADFRGGNLTYYDLNFTAVGPSSSGSIAGANNFHDVVFASKGTIINSNNFHNVIFTGDAVIEGNNSFNDLTFSPGHSYSLWSNSPSLGSVQTINGTFYANGSCGELIDIHAKVSGAKATVSHPPGNVNVSYVVLKDIYAAGGAAFIATNSSNLGNNTGWTFTTSGSQDLYWIGNSGNWDDGNHWSFTSGGPASGCSPTPSNNVIFDAASFTLPLQTVTINVLAAYCNNMNWSAATNYPTLAGPSSNLLKIYGSLDFIQLMNLNFTGKVNFEAISTGQTIKMAGKHFYDDVNFSGIGGGWTLLDEFRSSKIILLNAGILNTNNQVVTALKFQSTSGIARQLNMGSSVFNISGNDVCWYIDNGPITLNCGNSVINCSGSAADFRGYGLTYHDLNFTNSTVTASGSISDPNNFHDVVFSSKGIVFHSNNFHNATFFGDGRIEGDNIFNDLTFTAGHSYSIWSFTSSLTSTQTINGTFYANGTCGELVDIHAKVAGMQAIISHPAGAVDVSYVVLKDIKATGGAVFTATNSNDLGNNTGWTFALSGSQDLYWIGDSGNWDDGNHWSLTSGGAPSGCSPTPANNVFFDANSFSTINQVVTVNVLTAYCRNMSWTGVTSDPIFTGSSGNLLKIYGSLSFASNVNMTFSGPVNFEATVPGQTITMAGLSFYSNVSFNGIGGDWTLQDAFTNVNAIELNNGTLNTNDQLVTISQFKSVSGTNRTLNMGNSVFNLTGTTMPWWIDLDYPGLMAINAGTSVINLPSDEFLGGAEHTYYDVNFINQGTTPGYIIGSNGTNNFHNVVFASHGLIYHPSVFNTLTFQADGDIEADNVYNDLNFTSGHTYIIWKNTTQAINDHWHIQGSCTSYIVLQTNEAGFPATVTKASGDVPGYNIHLRDIHGSGGANFIAYNSVDLGGNAGWTFSTLPPLLSPDLIVGPSQVCPGANGVIYYIHPVVGAISYEWTVPAGATITSGQGDTLIVVNFGTANSGNITVESFNGCNFGTFSSEFAVVSGPPLPPTVTISSDQGNAACPGSPVAFTAVTTNTSGAVVNYDFMVNGNSMQNSASNIFTTTTLANGSVVICNIAVSATSCAPAASATSNSIVMTISPAAYPVNVNAGNDITIVPGQTTQLQGNGDAGIFTWAPPAGLSETGILNPVASPAVTTIYTLTITNSKGCSDSDNVKITVLNNCAGKPMNAITPNGDGINDRWIVTNGNCIITAHVRVFSRDGLLVFESKDYHNDWYGKYKGKELPDGTYYYMVEYKADNGEVTILKGDLTLLR